MLLNFNELVKKYNMNIKGVIHIGAHYGEEIQEYVNTLKLSTKVICVNSDPNLKPGEKVNWENFKLLYL